jgi:heterotetrameric sarcosine oxidase delta subunit
MKIPCPLCGPRDRREFYYYGSPDYLSPVGQDADLDALDNQLFLRDNIAGQVQDLWYHEGGCAAWLKVTRNTISHAVMGAELVMGAQAAPKPAAKPAAIAAAKPARAAAKPAVKAAPKPAAKPAAPPKTPKRDA